MTIVMVTNLVQQARRLAERTAFFLNGELVEVGETEEFFTGHGGGPTDTGIRGGQVWISPASGPSLAGLPMEGTLLRNLAIETEELNLWYGDFQALFDVDLRDQEGHDHLPHRTLRVR